MTTALYLRHSSKDKGDSIEGQRQLCEQWCQAHGITAWSEYAEDDTSAYDKRMSAREAWPRLEAEVRAGRVTRIVTRHTDRLYRNMLDVEHLVDLVEETGVIIETVWAGPLDLKTPTGRQLARITGAIARGESETKSERIRAKFAQHRAAGKGHSTGRPFGYVSARGTETVPQEAELVARGVAMLLEGQSLAAVTRAFNASGVPTVKGAPSWSQKVVRGVLLRWRNAGLIEHNGEIVGAGDWEPIVSREDETEVRRILLDPNRDKTPGGVRKGRNPVYLCSGIIECAKCGSPMHARTAHAPGGKEPARWGVYTCTGTGCYTSIKRDIVDVEAVRAMVRFYSTVELSDLVADDNKATLAALQAEAAALDAEEAEVGALIGSGALKGIAAGAALKALQDRRDDVDARLATVSAEHAATALLVRPMGADGRVSIEATAALKEAITAQPIEVQRKQLRTAYQIKCSPRGAVPLRGLGLRPDQQQQARLEFVNKIKPGHSFNLLDELTADLYN